MPQMQQMVAVTFEFLKMPLLPRFEHVAQDARGIGARPVGAQSLEQILFVVQIAETAL